MNIHELEKDFLQNKIKTGFDLYDWCEKHPDTAISLAFKRVVKIFDNADEIMVGFSGGKDSTIAARMAILELQRRQNRVANNVKRDGSEGIDPLDQKWVGKKIWMNHMHCEWVWTDTISYVDNFVKHFGPDGEDCINMFYKCLRLGWQSGVSFGDSRLTSWDLSKKDMWIMEMPTDLGLDVITNESIKYANPVPYDSLPDSWKVKRDEEGSVFVKDGVKYVANYGLGSKDLNLKGYQDVEFKGWTFENQDEDHEQESFTRWILEALPDGTKMYNLVALRASESFDRYSILKQSDYSTGQYAMNRL